MKTSSTFRQTSILLSSLLAGLFLGALNNSLIMEIASSISSIFMKVLKLIGLPLIFLSITSTLAKFQNLKEVLKLGKQTLFYTLLTTVIAALIALILYCTLVSSFAVLHTSTPATNQGESLSYISVVSQIIPDNMINPFLSNNVLSVAFLAVLIGLSSLFIKEDEKKILSKLWDALFSSLLKIAKATIIALPIVVLSFSVLLTQELLKGKTWLSLLPYLSCILLSNLVQGFVILPLLLKLHMLSPTKIFKEMFPALLAAFFSKSSSATLPLTMELAEERLRINPKISRFSFPLCSVINMNGCAAFILITILYVATINGVTFSLAEKLAWVGIASLAAIGNAGVPMGCYFLSSAILASSNFPLGIMGLILPFYTFLDMLETALNVWSDCCITSSVNKLNSLNQTSHSK